ncbi:DUF2442 domain-containing protein [Massilia endophytica]|uniref:DUF2442 domain-containing protein n=1 Tax=Massilia endophytica TaxID=2899220 RepID=UPI001E2F6223|nr:DUF2442 domain-containing protein [Massilia endophytica]UGQ46832.1 DUF2442 domain-containing protein [Massilia endophytica]
MSNSFARRVAFDAENMWVHMTDGRVLGVPLSFFPRLQQASTAEREQWIISGGGTGLHWDALDEDISVEHLMLGYGDRTRQSAASK